MSFFIAIIILYTTVLPLSITAVNHQEEPLEDRNKPEAFVTILYGSGFELGVRVLGQSIRESKSRLEYVVMCTPDVPKETIAVLKKDGWKIKMIEKFDPGEGKFDGSIHKMQMWRLTEYRRVLWIDADAILLQNIDHLVRCGNFCVSFRHSNLFNAGIMVMKPSIEELSRIMSLSVHYSSLPGTLQATAVALPSGRNIWGDQNLLNEYYDTVYNLKATRLFDEKDPRYYEEPMRIAEGYNTDLGLWLWNGVWTVDKEDMYILHYTAGPLKAHLWWTYPILGCNWEWYRLRKNLPSRYNDPSIWDLYNWVPLTTVVSLVLVLRFVPKASSIASSWLSRRVAIFIAPDKDGWFLSLFPTVFHLLCYYWSFYQVPSLMWPGEAWFVYGMWVVMFMVLFYVPMCYGFYMSTCISNRISARAVIETTVLVGAVFVVHLVFAGIVAVTSTALKRLITFLILFSVLLAQEHFTCKRILRIWYHYKSGSSNECECIL